MKLTLQSFGVLFLFSQLLMRLPEAASAAVPQPLFAGVDARPGAAVRPLHRPLVFEPNLGQANPAARFICRGPGYAMYFCDDEAVLVLPGSREGGNSNPRAGSGPVGEGSPLPGAEFSPASVLRMKFAEAGAASRPRGRDEQPGRSHYLIGSDPAGWRTNVIHYARVAYENVYPGVDLVFYGNESQLEFDFVVAPGGDPGLIHLEFEGADSLDVDADGSLVIAKAGRKVLLHPPQIYQEKEGIRHPVSGRFVGDGRCGVRFALGEYDRERLLVIDPVLSYSTYLGGSKTDAGRALAVDLEGNVIIVGNTQSTDFPTRNPLANQTGGLVFITKLRPDGSSPVFSTYFVASEANGVAVDSSGNILVTGVSCFTAHFPRVNPIQPAPDPKEKRLGCDAFVSKLNPSGSGLIYSSLLGGNHSDRALAIAVDPQGNAYITGSTFSTNFPVLNPLPGSEKIHGPIHDDETTGKRPSNAYFSDAFVAKISPAGALLYSTHLGGSNDEEGAGIAADASGVAYVVGYTASGNFPLSADAFQSEFRPPQDAFFVKLDPSGGRILYSTYFGGNAGLEIRPKTLAFRSPSAFRGQTKELVLKLRNPSTKSITVTGLHQEAGVTTRFEFINLPGFPFTLSPGEELPVTIRCVNCIRISVAGYTLNASIDDLEPDPAGLKQKLRIGFFLTGGDPSLTDTEEVKPAATSGYGADAATAIALDPAGNAFIAGLINSLDFPILGMQRPRPAIEPLDASDSFVARFSPTQKLQYSVILAGSFDDGASGVAVDDSGNAYVVGGTSSADYPTVDPLQAAPGNPVQRFGTAGDAFVTKLSPEGDPILFSTYLGGDRHDRAAAVAVDRNRNIYVTGSAGSGNFPTANPFQAPLGNPPGSAFFSQEPITDAFVVMITQGQAAREVQLWQKLDIVAPTGSDGPASFKVEFVRMVNGKEIRAEAPILAVRPGFVTVRVPPALLGPANLSEPPLGTDRNVSAEVLRASNRSLLVREPVLLRLPQPILFDEVDVRQNSVGLRTLTQFVLNNPSPNNSTFSFLGRSTDGLVGLRVLNTDLRFPAPLRFETDDVVAFEPEGSAGSLRLIGTPFHIPNLGPGNQGIQFTVSKTGLYVIAVEANTNSPGTFPARFQLHLAGNVGLPRKLVNGAPEAPRGTRLDTLFNHPAPREQSLLPGDIGVARTALFKFANVASISQFARAVLIPPEGGFAQGTRIVRAADPTAPLEISTPTARSPGCTAPVVGTVIDFTQVPDPASVVDPSPSLSETVCAVIGQNDGNGVTLPTTLPGGATITSLILDMGSGHEIVDGTGADFEVLAASGSYTVRVASTPFADSFSPAIGPLSGVQQIDLGATGFKSARYVWIIAAPSLVLDAVRGLNLFADEISPTIGPITHVTSTTITVRRAKTSANPLDPFVQLIAPNGDLFAENEAGFGDDLSLDLSDAALVNRILPQDGFYRYLVKGFDKQPDNQSSGTFFTRLETSGNYDPVELAVNSASEDQAVAQKTGTISAARQRDSFLFQAAPGTTINIVVNAKNSPADFDPWVELYDPEDFLIGASDDGVGRGRNGALTETLPSTAAAGGALPNPSTYRLVVSAKAGFVETSPLTAGKAHVRKAIGGNYELKVFTGALTGGQALIPRIDSINPSSGLVGISVTINGINFSSIAAENVVRFGSVQATVISATTTRVVTAVPAGLPPGATSLTVSVAGRTSGPAAFTVTASEVLPPTINGTQASKLADVSKPGGLAIDGAGNLFTVGRDSGVLTRITPAGAVSAIAQLGTDPGGWFGPAVDSAGNLYVSHFTANEVLRIASGGKLTVFASGIPQPAGLTVDSSDNVYVTSFATGKVFKLTPKAAASLAGKDARVRASLQAQGDTASVSEYVSGLSKPIALVFGPSGELYVASQGNNQIGRIPPGGGQASLFAQLARSPESLVIDRSGTLVAGTTATENSNDAALLAISPAGVVTTLRSGLGSATGLAVDTNRNLYIADRTANTVFKSLLPLISPGPRTARASLHSLSLRFQPASGQVFGFDFTLALTSLSEDDPPNGELYPDFGSDGSDYASSFLLDSPELDTPILGFLALAIPTSGDSNQNGLDDFFEVSRSVDGANTTGEYETELDDGVIEAAWTRAAGSKSGTCRIKLTGATSGFLGEFTFQFEVLEYSGPLTYTAAERAVSASVKLAQTFGGADSITGDLRLERSAEGGDRLNLVSGVWTNAVGKQLQFGDSTLQRSTATGSNYQGELFFEDGDPGTAEGDFFEWILLVTDSNDSDGDGIPDLSDEPATTEPVQRPRLSVTLDLANRTLLLSVTGQVGTTVDVEQTSSLTSTIWTTQMSLTLVTVPQTVQLPIIANSTRFYRVRLK